MKSKRKKLFLIGLEYTDSLGNMAVCEVAENSMHMAAEKLFSLLFCQSRPKGGYQRILYAKNTHTGANITWPLLRAVVLIRRQWDSFSAQEETHAPVH